MQQATMPNGLFKSSPVRAIRAVIETPNWAVNLLWLSIASLLNSVFIGQIALFGYGAELLERRAGRPDAPTVDVDSNRLVDYIAKGVWPFVVLFLVQIVVGIIVSVPIILLVIVGLAVGSAAGGDATFGIAMILVAPLVLLLLIAATVATVPFLIRAMICQDFLKSFDLGWAMGFIRIMFWEMIVSGILYYLMALGLLLVGFALLCIGQIPAMGAASGAAMHLLAQWYEVYLSRGGVPASPPAEAVVDATII